jgi:hypothetical protein
MNYSVPVLQRSPYSKKAGRTRPFRDWSPLLGGRRLRGVGRRGGLSRRRRCRLRGIGRRRGALGRRVVACVAACRDAEKRDRGRGSQNQFLHYSLLMMTPGRAFNAFGAVGLLHVCCHPVTIRQQATCSKTIATTCGIVAASAETQLYGGADLLSGRERLL